MTADAPVRDPGGFVPGRWRNLVACASVPLETFFPGPYQSHAEAKAVCAGCPVRLECTWDALNVHEHAGIRGGFNFGDQRSRRRASQWLEDALKSRHHWDDTQRAS